MWLVLEAIGAALQLIEGLCWPFKKGPDLFPLWLRWVVFTLCALLLLSGVAGLLLAY